MNCVTNVVFYIIDRQTPSVVKGKQKEGCHSTEGVT